MTSRNRGTQQDEREVSGETETTLSAAVNAQEAAAAVAAFVAEGDNPPAGLFPVGGGPTVGPKQ